MKPRDILAKVEPVDALAILAVVLIAAGVAAQWGVAFAAITVGALLLAYAILASRSQVTP